MLEKNSRLTEDHTKLYIEFERAGYFQPSYLQTFIRVAELFVLAGVGLSLTYHPNNALKFIGIIFLSTARVRGGFLQHELGHYSQLGNPKLDRILEAVIYGKYSTDQFSKKKRKNVLQSCFYEFVKQLVYVKKSLIQVPF